MYHDPALGSAAAKADPRPTSAVSTATGLVGLAGLLTWVGIARWFGMDGPYAALVNVAAAGVPMVLWSVLVDKVHRNPSTGIDWANPRPWRETLDISITKLAGLWLTWAGIAAIYAIGRFYWVGGFRFSMWCFMWMAPILFVLSIPYTLWLDRRMVEPKDGCWSLGAWLMGLSEPVDRHAIYSHLRSWGVKAFFTAFMLAIVPPGFGDFVRGDMSQVWSDPVILANWLITFMFRDRRRVRHRGVSARDAAARFAHPHRHALCRGMDGRADLLPAVRADGRWRAARLPSRHARGE